MDWRGAFFWVVVQTVVAVRSRLDLGICFLLCSLLGRVMCFCALLGIDSRYELLGNCMITRYDKDYIRAFAVPFAPFAKGCDKAAGNLPIPTDRPSGSSNL